MLINAKSLSTVLVMISSMYVPSATVFTLFESITAKRRLFRGYPSLTPSFEGNPTPNGTKFCHDKLATLGQPTVKIP